jgi:tRNA threonylcarbamoyladenosine biosynthesis protein TsaE
MKINSFLTHSAEETEKLAEKIINDELFSEEHEDLLNTKVVLLKGPLGSGKTTFTKGIATSLGIEDKIKSPTYTYSNHYEFTKNDITWKLIHFDLYRLDDEINNPEQVSAEIGLEEALQRPKTLVVIEWPERLELEKADVMIELETETESHKITVL